MVCNLTGVINEQDAPDGERHHTLGFLGREGSAHLQGLEGSAHLEREGSGHESIESMRL